MPVKCKNLTKWKIYVLNWFSILSSDVHSLVCLFGFK